MRAATSHSPPISARSSPKSCTTISAPALSTAFSPGSLRRPEISSASFRFVGEICVWVEARFPLRRLLAYTHRASRANYNGARESLATRDAAYEDTSPLLYGSVTARARSARAAERPQCQRGLRNDLG